MSLSYLVVIFGNSKLKSANISKNTRDFESLRITSGLGEIQM